MVVPGLYGFVGACKWMTRHDPDDVRRGPGLLDRSGSGRPTPRSRRAPGSTPPQPLSTIKAGKTVIGGVAWAQHRGIGKVEVRIDDGAWQETRLGPDVGIDYWRQWYLPWDAKPGQHRIAVRATDLKGRRADRRARRRRSPSGVSGIQEVVVTVA